MAKKREALTTAAQVKAVTPEGKAYVHSMKGDRGLYIKVQPSGLKTWYFRSRVGDKFEWLTLGEFKTGADGMSLAGARDELARQRVVKKQHGSAKAYRDEQKAQQLAELEAKSTKATENAYTVAKLCKEYIEAASRDLKSWAEVDRALKKYVIPHIGNRPARGIRRTDVIALLDPLNKKGKTTQANRVLAYLRRAFNWSINRGAFDTDTGPEMVNPCQRIEMNEEKSKDRALSDTEIRRLLTNLPRTALTATEQDLVIFLLLTGVRLGEAVSAPLTQVDEDSRTLILTDTKNGSTHVVPLCARALAIATRRKDESKWLFPMDTKPKRHMRADRLSTPLREELPKLKVMKFTPHDLRRTFATGLAALKAPRLIVSLALNHRVADITSVYDRHTYADELREWYDKWGAHIESLTSQPEELQKVG